MLTKETQDQGFNGQDLWFLHSPADMEGWLVELAFFQPAKSLVLHKCWIPAMLHNSEKPEEQG